MPKGIYKNGKSRSEKQIENFRNVGKWHQDKEKDRLRDIELKEVGYDKIIHIEV